MRQTSLSFATFALFALVLNCATLSPIAVDTCGNGVVDANEDCDSFPASCGHPGDGARACRYVCDRKQAGSCPVGWGCSVDGFCRQATGSFDPAGAPTPAAVVDLLTGDFDGDGRVDLVGRGSKLGASKPRVFFFDSNGVAATPVSLPFAAAEPVVRDFDGDGRDDLAFAVGGMSFGSFGLLAGSADRAFSPLVFPTIVKAQTALTYAMLPFDPAKGFVVPAGGAAAVTLERDGTGTWFRSVSSGNLVGEPELQMKAPIGPEQVVGAPAYGHLFDPDGLTPPTPPSACGQVVFPYNNGEAGYLAIVSPCGLTAPTESRWVTRPVQIFPVCVQRLGSCTPAKITGRTTIANVGTKPAVFVETGAAPNTVTLAAVSNGSALSRFEEQLIDAPLATGDLGTGDISWVVPQGAYTRDKTDGGTPTDTTPTFTRPIATPSGGRWTSSAIGRFNGDDLPDIVAFSEGALEVEFFSNAGSGLFTRFSISSDEPVRAITTGDFDGDRIEDIAFLASSRPLGDADSAEVVLYYAYGQASGGPEAPRVVGRFSHATSVAALTESDTSISDVGVVGTVPAQQGLPSSSLTVIVNSGDRQSLAPLVFSDAASTTAAPKNSARTWIPMALAAAPFFAPGANDVLAVAFGLTVGTERSASTKDPFIRPFPSGVWVARNDKTGVGQLSAFREIFRFDATHLQALDYSLFEQQGVIESLMIAAWGDVDSPPDGVSEIVSLSRSSSTTTDLLVVRPNDLIGGKVPKTQTLADFAVTGDDEISVFDVSGDGLPDVLVLTRALLNADDPNREKLRVYLNDGHGGFDTRPIVFDVPKRGSDAASVPVSVPVGVARVVTGAANGKPKAELAVVAADRLLLATLSSDNRSFDVRDITSVLGSPLSGRITGVASGDFDGDGVQDLAVADSGGVRIIRQQPRLR